ncbi:MAG: cysteine protease StiP family protein [Agitococcus sp.]|nr:cysteine protease StiP family protein [Agitococcus sp.]MDO9178696.1 cysteine protease StiP family protein [Agitococcus sp.]
MTPQPFSGSYALSDVQFLLKVIDVPVLDISEKERRIQQQTAHYSEVLSKEQPPSEQYLDLYRTALLANGRRMAQDVLKLASHLNHVHPQGTPIVLVSLARAGTPIGVLLKRTLEQFFNRVTAHYSISIIRDRGIDKNAMSYILAKHQDTEIAFIDGWTGKGVITEELASSIVSLNAEQGLAINPALYVLTDLAGVAGYAASFEDYLIPSSILNASVSGLISRTVLNERYIGPTEFHGCLYYREFETMDMSSAFVDAIFSQVVLLIDTFCYQTANRQHMHGNVHLVADYRIAPVSNPQRKGAVNTANTKFIQQMLKQTGLTNRNYIKPGVGEATRVLLRRVPDCLYLQDALAEETRHLVVLANEKNVPIIVEPTLLYKATAIIKIVD